jgi:hypothetical protein
MKIFELDDSIRRKVAESGAFSYGSKKPRKGSVADLAAKKRKEHDKQSSPIEPKDQLIGTAKVVREAQTYTPDQRSAAVKEFDNLYVTGFEKGWSEDDLARLNQLIKITGRNQRSWVRSAKLGEMLDYATQQVRAIAAKSGKLAAFTGKATTTRDLGHQIALHTNGKYSYRRGLTWTRGSGGRYKDPSDFIVYPDKDAFDDAVAWVASKGNKIHFKDHYRDKNVRTGYKIGKFLITDGTSTLGVFSDNPVHTYALSIRSAAALGSGGRVVQDLTDQQAAAISDIAATKTQNSMELIAAMLNILKGRDELQGIMDRSKVDVLKNIVDQSKKINMQDKAKLDSIINSAGQFKESTLPIDDELDEATYSAGGGVRLDFNVKDTVRHIMLGELQVVGFDGGSAIVKNNKGQAFKVSPSSLTLVKKASATTQHAPIQTTAAPTASAGAPVGQTVTYNSVNGPVKFTKTNKGWEALYGTVRKIFSIDDKPYGILEKLWHQQHVK